MTTKGNFFVNERTDVVKLADVLFVIGLILVIVPVVIYNVYLGSVMAGIILIALSLFIASSRAQEEEKKDKT